MTLFARVLRPIAVGTAAVLIMVAVTSPADASPTRILDAKDGFAFALPSTWLQIPLTGKDVAGLLDVATKADPSLATALSLQVQQDLKKGVKIFALGPIVGKFASNLNVIVESSAGLPSGAGSFDMLGVEVKIELASLGITHIATSQVKVAGSAQLAATYSPPVTMTKVGAYGEQLYIHHGPRLVIATVTSASQAQCRSTARAIASTWTWK